jgi:hypothetical protein
MVIQKNKHVLLESWNSLVCLDLFSRKSWSWKVCGSNLIVEILILSKIRHKQYIYLAKPKNILIYFKMVKLLRYCVGIENPSLDVQQN